jgi:hypothetical protein
MHAPKLAERTSSSDEFADIAPLSSLRDVRRHLGIATTKIYQLTSAGILRTTKIGRRTLWTRESLLNVIAEGAP